MKDIEPPAPVWQTFNLRIGGQDDPGAKFASLQAKQERTWKRFQEKVLELIAETGTCLCRVDFALNCGYRIGEALFQTRILRRFLNDVETATQRTKWLEDRPGWSWTVRSDSNAVAWELFQQELLAHVQKLGTSYVTARYVSPSGYKLGQRVAEVRCGHFIYGDSAAQRRDWLNTLPGWTWNAKNSIEARRIQSNSTKKQMSDQAREEVRLAKQLETMKRKREERWATLNDVELAEAKHQFEIDQRGKAIKKTKRQAKARGEADDVEEKKPQKTSTKYDIRNHEKVKADLAALKATLVPKAKRHQVPRYRKDGTVAKAHQILRERSVDAGV